MNRFLAGGLALLAAGCTAVAPPPGAPWPEERAALQALDQWRLDGRIAVAAGGDGFSGGLAWEQDGERARIALRGPMGGTRLTIEVAGEAFAVTDEQGRRLDGDEARRFVAERLGPERGLPIAEMRYWVLGVPAPNAPFEETISPERRLASLAQSGWQVRYDRFTVVDGRALPARIEMTAGNLRLRVAISGWHVTS